MTMQYIPAKTALLAIMPFAFAGCATVTTGSVNQLPGQFPQPIFSRLPCKTVVAEDKTPQSAAIPAAPAAEPVPGLVLDTNGTPEATPASTSDCANLFGTDEVYQRTEVAATPYAPGEGVAYFLPRQLATVTATRIDSALAAKIKAVSEAEAKVGAAKVRVEAAEAASYAAEQKLRVTGLDRETRRLLELDRSDENASLRASRTALTAAIAAQATAVNELKQASAADPKPISKYKDLTLNIALDAPSADPAFAFRIQPRHSILRDDEHKFTLTNGGLLSNSTIVATDRTADVLVEIANLAGFIKGFSGGGRDDSDPAPRDCANPPPSVALTVDFTNVQHLTDLNYDLQCFGVRISVEQEQDAPVGSLRIQGRTDGIFYRTPRPVRLRIERCTDADGNCGTADKWFTTQMMSVILPQAGPISWLRQDAGFATKTRYANVFDNGILTSYDASRPSEALHVAATPIRMVTAFFDGFSKVLSLRTGTSNAQTALVQAQTNLATAQSAQLVAALTGQTSLTNAELTLLQSQYGLRAGPIAGDQKLTEAETQRLRATLALQSLGITGATGLTNDQIAQADAANRLALATINNPVQISSAELAALLALTRNQARTDQLKKCINAQLAVSLPIDPCLN